MPGVFTVNAGAGLNVDEERLKVLCSVLKECRSCPVGEAYRSPVLPSFSARSDVMVVGEIPGVEELRTGKPYLGKGKVSRVLNNAFLACRIPRDRLYFTYCWKCRPMDGTLYQNISTTCWNFLRKEIEILRPRLIVALGKSPLKVFTGQESGIMSKSGTTESIQIGDLLTTVLWCVSPAAVLQSSENHELFKNAFIKLNSILN